MAATLAVMVRAAALLALAATTAHAEPPRGEPKELSTSRRALAVLTAIIPGAVIHGLGSYVAGEQRTAKRLFLSQLASAGLSTGGGILVGGTGGNSYAVPPGVPLLTLGFSGLVAGWFSDIYVAAAGTEASSVALGSAPVSVEVGTVYQHDAFRERGYARLAVELNHDRHTVRGTGLFDAEGGAQTGELAYRARLLGKRDRWVPLSDGSHLSITGAVRAQRDAPDRVTQQTAELLIGGRLDLRHFDAALAGSFAEFATGAGAQRVSYAGGRASQVTSLMLGTFAWGMYLGRHGELSLFYDHRRDSLAGGLPAWRAAGFVGSFGATTTIRVGGPWAVRAEFEVGNAYVTTFAVQYLGGKP